MVVPNSFYFHPYFGEVIQFDLYFSDGLVQPPPSYGEWIAPATRFAPTVASLEAGWCTWLKTPGSWCLCQGLDRGGAVETFLQLPVLIVDVGILGPPRNINGMKVDIGILRKGDGPQEWSECIELTSQLLGGCWRMQTCKQMPHLYLVVVHITFHMVIHGIITFIWKH